MAALMATVSASEPNNLWLHPDPAGGSADLSIRGNNWGNVVWITKDSPDWLKTGGLDLQQKIVDKLTTMERKWEYDENLAFDCRGDWGQAYIEVAGSDTKYCQGTTASGPPNAGNFLVKAPIPPPPPYKGTNTGKPFYNDIRGQELKCIADRNSEWHYDAATNTGTCTKNNLKPYKPYEPEHDIRAQKQAGVVQKALKK